MKKLAWKIAMGIDGILAFIFISSFDVDEMVIQYVGALFCIVIMLFLLAIGWQWIMDEADKDELQMWEFMDERDR